MVQRTIVYLVWRMKLYYKFKTLIYFWWLVNRDGIKQFLKPSMFVSFFLAWQITNGHAYLLLWAGYKFGITWMKAYGLAYVSILYLPFTAEKAITIPISIYFQKIIFNREISTTWKYKHYCKTKLGHNEYNNILDKLCFSY